MSGDDKVRRLPVSTSSDSMFERVAGRVLIAVFVIVCVAFASLPVAWAVSAWRSALR